MKRLYAPSHRGGLVAPVSEQLDGLSGIGPCVGGYLPVASYRNKCSHGQPDGPLIDVPAAQVEIGAPEEV